MKLLYSSIMRSTTKLNPGIRLIMQKKWIPLIILVIFTSCFFFLIASPIEPDLYDESLYFLTSFFDFNAKWSPLYSAYYWVVKLFFTSRLNIFFVTSYLTSAVLLPIATYLLTYRFFKDWTVSVVVALIFFLSDNNFGLYTRLHVFNFSILTLIYLVFCDERSILKMILFSLLLGLSIHLRPENLISSVFLLSVLIFNYLRNNKGLKKFVIPNLLLAAFIATFALPRWGGLHPIFSGSERTFSAFIDHYTWTHPNTVPNWTAFEKFYPKSNSIISFVISYPNAFLQHVWSNLAHVPIELLKTLNPYHTALLPLHLLLLLFLTGLSMPVQYKRTKKISLDWIFLAALVLTSLILNTALHPWTQYMLGLSFLMMMLAVSLGQFLSRKFSSFLNFFSKRFISYALIFIFFLASLVNFKTFPKSNFSNLAKELSHVEIRKDEKILFTNFLPLYIDSKNLPILYTTFGFPRNQFKSIGQWTSHEKISLFCHSDLYDLPEYTSLTDVYHDFIANSAEYGFKPYYNGALLWCVRKEVVP